MPEYSSNGKSAKPLNVHQDDFDSAERGPCVLAYGPADPAGLGHLRRNTNIALRFAGETLSGNALVIGVWPPGLCAHSTPGVDFIKLPSVQRTAARTWRPSSLRIGLDRLLDLRSSVIVTTLETLEPDVFLVDHLPAGYCGELEPALDFLKRRSSRTKTVLGLRDILDAPDVIRREWERDGVYDVLQRYYDLILIYGDPTVFDAAAHYDLNRTCGGKVVYCGYVGPSDLPKPGVRLPDESSPDGAKHLLIMGGGGFDAYPMMSMCIGAIARMRNDTELDCTLITGPLMDRSEYQSIKNEAAGLPIVVAPYVDNPLDYIRRADLVIGMAGYNTVVETMSLGKRMLVVPRGGPSAEQSMRGDIFAAKGYVATRRLEDSSPESFAEAIWRSLESQPSAGPMPDFNGLTKVVEELRKTAAGACRVS
ncbi:MAG TPA: glycosyltransferase [Blastocatellia bacterium]